MRRVLVVALAVAFLAAAPPSDAAEAARLPVAEPGVEGSIERLYLLLLGRPADPAGLDHWAAAYRDGLPLRSVAEALAATPEFAARHGDGAAARVADLVAEAESPAYVAATGTAPPVVPRRLLAPAGVEHSVARVYLGLLQRWPDAAGFDHWVRRYLAGAPLRSVTDAILAAPELVARYGDTTDGAFVRGLYDDVLGRPADDAGLAWWTAALAGGRTRGEVTTAFTESPEFVARTRTAPPAPPTGRRLLAVGDSVMLGARDNILAIPGWTISVDVRGCRNPTLRLDGCGATRVPSGVDALRLARAEGRMGDVVVLSLGNNGPMSAAMFDEVMAEVLDVPRVIWFNQHEPRSYEGPNNAVIAAGVARYPNAELIDWHGLAQGQPWFAGDGIHLSHAGRQAMADLIAQRIGDG